MKIITSAGMRETDRVTAERHGVPLLTLMENAGTGVAEFVLRAYPQAQRIGVVCGKGNNGGDGFVAARKLHQAGKQVQVLLLADPAQVKGDAAAMLPKVPVPVIAARSEDDLADELAQDVFGNDLLIDAILGSGFTPPVQGLYAAAIARLNRAAVPVVAVDVPSGADADSFAPQPAEGRARAAAVVTFTAPRPGHIFGCLSEGATVVHPIGSPAEAVQASLQLNVLAPREIAGFLLPRAAAANKGAFGHVLVIGGSVGKAGAAAMAGMAALRVGAGLATVATPKSVLPTVAGFAPEIMTEPLAETEAGSISLQTLASGRIDALMERKNVLAVGPGIGRDPDTAAFVRELLRSAKAAVVLDADGLNAFEGCAEQLSGGAEHNLVITPHPGEMARLTGMTIGEIQADRIAVARRFAQDHGCVVVLKGWRTVIAEPTGEAWINTTGNPGMAKGGSGDILTGMIAGLLAQFPAQVTMAAAIGVYLHGLAGDVARELVGELSMTATDLLRTLPSALARVADLAKDPFARIA
jgi:hydroxyethylthiazole kinase-like uncharacterized protein yjeF